MPSSWWTRKYLIVAAGIIALACASSVAAFGLSTPEPAASAALGPEWQCSRLIFVFTTCSRIKHSQARVLRLAKIGMCGRLRT
jgi:hypothetical protein